MSTTQNTGWLRRLVAQSMRHRFIVCGALAITIISAAIDVALPLITKRAIDGANRSETHMLNTIAITLMILAVAYWASQYTRRMLAGRLSLNVQHDLRLELLGALQRLDGPGQDRVRTGQVVSRSITDLQLVQGLLAMVPLSAGAALQLVGAIVVMAYLSPLLTIVALLVVPAVALTVGRSRKRLFAATWSAGQRGSDLAQHVEETVTGVRVVKGFGQELRAVHRIETLGRRLYAERLRAARLNARFTPTMAALPQVGLVAVIAFGGYLALHAHITVGTFLAFAIYVTAMTSITRLLTNVIVTAQLARAAVERVYEVIDADPGNVDIASPAPLPAGAVGIRLRDVHFGFDNSAPVLDGVDLTVAPGSTVAIVGRSGSGKTALALLLARFYRPEVGAIELFDQHGAVNIADAAARDLRSTVTVAFDEPFLFSTTIAENIALGKPDASDEEIVTAARLAAAHDFINALPEGYDSLVGERGLTLSGGQRQRIALARAILTQPRVLILDDATSAVDSETEARILDALRTTAPDSTGSGSRRTAVVLAHRRSTLALADQVAVLDNGRITDVGTVAELDARSSLFRELLSAAAPPASTSAAVTEDVDLWPEAEATREQRLRPADGSGRPGGGGGRGGGGPVSGALGAMAATPELLDLVTALPEATEDPAVDDTALEQPTSHFSLSGLLRPVRWLLVIALVLLAADSLASLAFPALIRDAVDRGVGHASGVALAVATLAGLVVVAGDWLVVSAMTLITARAGERVLYALRVRSFAHLQRLGLDYYERELSGRIMTRMTTDVDALSAFLQTGMTTAVVSVLTIVGVAAALLLTDLVLGAVALTVLLPLVVATIIFRRVSSAAYAASRERISAVNADFHENIAGLRVAQAYSRESIAASQFAERATAYRSSRMRAQQAISVYFPLIAALADLAQAAVIFIGAHQLARGQISAGVLVAFILYLGLLFNPVQQLSQVFDGYQQARIGLRRIGDLLATRTTVADEDADVEIVGHLDGDVEFRDVSFSYNGAAKPAITHIDLRIPAGTSLALVGATGAGKSTLVKLLARFYDPTEGSVLVDGVDIRRYHLAQYRSRLGVVPQEAHLFTGDVASNIAFGDPEAEPQRIEAAAAAVGAQDMIARLPSKMRQPIGERGQGLSAGQRQLVALARAELVSPDLMLLDEATATLDPSAERAVFAASKTVMRSRTSVVVAHRLTTAARADRIALVAGGQITELGTHEELLALGGGYAALWATGLEALPNVADEADQRSNQVANAFP